jgi:glycosyltransferase involved in cell wall biosynthesis
MNVAIYCPPSAGCRQSASLIDEAIRPFVEGLNGKVVQLCLSTQLTQSQLEADASAQLEVTCAIYCERVIDHPALKKAKYQILIPNPEWLDPRTHSLAGMCTHVWHKSHFSLQRLAPIFPQAEHSYLGFTSPDPGLLVSGYESFVHLRGKLATHRNTNSILTHWRAVPSLPDLYVHFYANNADSIRYEGWLSDRNVHVRIGWLKRREYLDLAARHGLHLCTSEVEGYGHYINEARAMGALVVTTNGAPMNELVDADCGVLVQASSSRPMNFGTCYLTSPDDLAPGIDKVLSLSLKERQALGAEARQRFLIDDRRFRWRVRGLMETIA